MQFGLWRGTLSLRVGLPNVENKTMEILVDARAMVPPEPFESSMEALEDLQSGYEVILWLFRQPMPLFDVLKRNGYAWKETVGPENCFEYRISRCRN